MALFVQFVLASGLKHVIFFITFVNKLGKEHFFSGYTLNNIKDLHNFKITSRYSNPP